MRKSLFSCFLFFFLLSTAGVFGAPSAKKSYLIAEALFEKGEYDKCLTQLDKTVEALGKTNHRIQCLRVNALYRLHNVSNLKKELDVFFSFSGASQAQINSMTELKEKIAREEANEKETREVAQVKEISGSWKVEVTGSSSEFKFIGDKSIVNIVQKGKEVTIYADTLLPNKRVFSFKPFSQKKQHPWTGTFTDSTLKATTGNGYLDLLLSLDSSGDSMKGKVNSTPGQKYMFVTLHRQ